jgi:alanine-synthesizing transaminase
VFSRRTPAPGARNRLTRALEGRRTPPLDLTVTNPTAVGLERADRFLEALADPHGLRYEPDPKGLRSAREALAAWYAERGVAANPDRVVLTASSSEAYGFLLKLLCDPGDAVLVPAPSYPLLDALAELEGVPIHRYPLDEAGGWAVHAPAVARGIERLAAGGRRVGAVVVVSPNNPTGTGILREELRALLALSRERGFGLISDEVFLDYRFAERPGDAPVAAAEDAGLVFSLGGLSKSAALPQLKLGWILANGPAGVLAAALSRLEWIADAYLSVGTPVQLALPRLLEHGRLAADAIRARIVENHAALAAAFPPGSPASAEPLVGGWSAVLRVPALEPEEDLVLRLLADHDLLVHPGYFFDFPREGFLVLSLLPAPELFREGVSVLARALGVPG